jgi:WD40 repeat protein
LIASGQRGDNADILIWDFATKKAIFRLSEHDGEVGALGFSHDDRILLSTGGTLDGKLFLWDMTNGYIIASKAICPSLTPEAPVALGFGGFVKDVKLRDTPFYQFCTSASQSLCLWSLEPATGGIEGTFIPTGSYVRHYISFCFSKPR